MVILLTGVESGMRVPQMRADSFTTATHLPNDSNLSSRSHGSPLIAPIVPNGFGPPATGASDAIQYWRQLHNKKEQLLKATEPAIRNRDRKEFDDLRRRFFESKKSKADSTKEPAQHPPCTSRAMGVPQMGPYGYTNLSPPIMGGLYEGSPPGNTMCPPQHSVMLQQQGVLGPGGAGGAEAHLMMSQRGMAMPVEKPTKQKRKNQSSANTNIGWSGSSSINQPTGAKKSRQTAPKTAASIAQSSIIAPLAAPMLAPQSTPLASHATPSSNAIASGATAAASSSSGCSGSDLLSCLPDFSDELLAEFISNSCHFLDDVSTTAAIDDVFGTGSASLLPNVPPQQQYQSTNGLVQSGDDAKGKRSSDDDPPTLTVQTSHPSPQQPQMVSSSQTCYARSGVYIKPEIQSPPNFTNNCNVASQSQSSTMMTHQANYNSTLHFQHQQAQYSKFHHQAEPNYNASFNVNSMQSWPGQSAITLQQQQQFGLQQQQQQMYRNGFVYNNTNGAQMYCSNQQQPTMNGYSMNYSRQQQQANFLQQQQQQYPAVTSSFVQQYGNFPG